MIPHENVHYHDHYLYHRVPNDNEKDKGITDIISDDDKENSGNNCNRYNNRIPGHHRSASKDGSNSPSVLDNHSEGHALDRHISSNHGGSNGPSHNDPPSPDTPHRYQKWH